MISRIIDCHSHLAPDENALEEFVEECKRLNIVKICFMGLEYPSSNHSKNWMIEIAMKKYPKLVVGFAGINLWEKVEPQKVEELYEKGFRGLKFIIPCDTYHSERYYPYYEKASQLNMPICFHLGIVARSKNKKCRVDNNLMRPIYLDTIARDFPNLILWGAHLGNPWYEEATMSCRWNPNLFFDLSGSTLKKKKPEWLGELLWWRSDTAYTSPDKKGAWEKILFGSDTSAKLMEDVINDYENLINTLNLGDEIKDKIFYSTAKELLEKAGVRFE